MRLRELINEKTDKKLGKNVRQSHPHAKQYDDIDQYYGMYRFGIAMAGAPGESINKAGPAKDVPTVWLYSKGDEDIVNKAEKNQGIKGKNVVKKGHSDELKDINKVSPIANPKRNKYGI